MHPLKSHGHDSLFGKQVPTIFRRLDGRLGGAGENPIFQTTWKTDNAGVSNNDEVKLPLVVNGTYDMVVDWGDSTVDNITAWDQSEVTHTYASSGTYTIKIVGQCEGWTFGNAGDEEKLLNVDNWGILTFIAQDTRVFWGCVNLDITATDTPTIGGMTNMEFMFRECGSLINANDSIGTWNITGVTNLFNCFINCVLFDGDLGGWDVSAVTKYDNCFDNCEAFTGKGLDNWTINTSDPHTMVGMFVRTNVFDSPNIIGWNTSQCTDMSRMFELALAFDQDIDGWDVGNVTRFINTFANVGSGGFSQGLNSWDVSSVTTFSGMFAASSYNGNISAWTTTSATDMSFMFFFDDEFNQDVSGWDVSGIIDFTSMFDRCGTFDQDLSGWSVTATATNISFMFRDCTLFDSDISGWNVSNVTTMEATFSSATSFDQDLSSWSFASVDEMTNFLAGVTLSTSNYDPLLVQIESTHTESDVTFDGGNSLYTDPSTAATARAALVTDGWTITDGGPV